jgi:hypothetical protein
MIRKSTGIILATFIVLLIISFFLNQTWNSQETYKTPSSTPFELALPADIFAGLSAISFKNSIGDMLIITKKMDGKWFLSSEPRSEVSSAKIVELITNLESLEIFSKLNSSSNVSELGLSPADQEIILKNSKRNPAVISIGNLTPTGSGYYLEVDYGDPVIIRRGSMETILGLLTRENLVIAQTSPP